MSVQTSAPPARARQRPRQRRLRDRRAVRGAQPAAPGAVAGGLAQDVAEALGIAVGDHGPGPVVELPAPLLDPPAELDVRVRPHLAEAADGLERRPADEQVRRRPGGPRAEVELMRGDRAAARPRPAGEQRRLVVRAPGLAGDDRAALAGLGVGEPVEQVGRGHAVGVGEQEPAPGGHRGAGVASVKGRTPRRARARPGPPLPRPRRHGACCRRRSARRRAPGAGARARRASPPPPPPRRGTGRRRSPPAAPRSAYMRSGALTPSSPSVVAIVRFVATQRPSRAASAPGSVAPTTRQSR